MMYICVKRTQDLEPKALAQGASLLSIDGKDDPFCIACWEESEKGLNDFVPSEHYVDREDCIEEFCVTEEEFDKICITTLNTNPQTMVKSS